MKVEEIWKDIENYNGLYQVSNHGRVKSLERKVPNQNRIYSERILKPEKPKCGYLYCALCKDGFARHIRVHRLVAFAFIPNPYNKPQVNHKDGNKQNNSADNLEWCTNSENVSHSYGNTERGKARHWKGKMSNNHPNSKKVQQHTLDGVFVREWNCAKDIERELGFDCRCISACCRGKSKSSFNYKWNFKNS